MFQSWIAKGWVMKNYSDEKIKQVLNHPQKGVWNRNVLREMLNKKDLTIDPFEYEMAIMNLVVPSPLIKEFWKRKFGSKKNQRDNPQGN